MAAATVVGRYVYVVGGHTGGASGAATRVVQVGASSARLGASRVIDVAQRAYLLAPAEAPVVALDLDLDAMSTQVAAATSGPTRVVGRRRRRRRRRQMFIGGAGVWYYAISAVYDTKCGGRACGGGGGGGGGG